MQLWHFQTPPPVGNVGQWYQPGCQVWNVQTCGYGLSDAVLDSGPLVCVTGHAWVGCASDTVMWPARWNVLSYRSGLV